MSVAWTTVAIIALLLPGVFFLIGLATSERYSREIVRASAVSEIAVALLVAILVHLLALGLLRLIGFDAESFFRPLIDLDTLAPEAAVHAAFERVWRVLLYVAATAVLSFILGFVTSRLVKAGPLRWLAVHKWPHDIPEGGSVTAYILTTTADNDRALMYKGFLHEYYLDPDGTFSYIVLTGCSCYFMHFGEQSPKTGEQLAMNGPSGDLDQSIARFLIINGDNVANVVFDTAAGIDPGVSAEGVEAELSRALSEANSASQAKMAD
jgi:hypothetical protein